jgi:hypothetical protein
MRLVAFRDRATLPTQHANVYAIGDVTSISILGRWKPNTPLLLPKGGVVTPPTPKVISSLNE